LEIYRGFHAAAEFSRRHLPAEVSQTIHPCISVTHRSI